MALQVSNYSTNSGVLTLYPHLLTDASDFERLVPIRVTNNAEVNLSPSNDEVTLEYDDRVLLRFTPDQPVLIPSPEGYGEYIRDTATVHIIDSDCKCSSHEKLSVLKLISYIYTSVLEINFEESDYYIAEGSERLSSPITLQFRGNQNPFNLTLTAVTVDTAEAMGLGLFINSYYIDRPSFRATAGISSIMLF